MSNLRWIALIVVGAMSMAAAARADMATNSHGKPGASVVLQITNSRSVALKELDATPSGLFLPKMILGALAPGKKATAKLAPDTDCVFDLRGSYADASSTESTGVDLCNDQR